MNKRTILCLELLFVVTIGICGCGGTSINTTESVAVSEPVTSSESTATSEPVTSSESTATSEPVTSSESTATSEPVTSSESTATSEPVTSSESTATSEPVTSSEPITTSEPEQLFLTDAMIEDIKNTYGDDIKMDIFFTMLLRELGGEVTVSSVEILDEEKYNSYSYIYYYRVHYDQDYSHYKTDVKMVIEAFEDTSEEKGYKLDPVHLYEGDTQLW